MHEDEVGKELPQRKSKGINDRGGGLGFISQKNEYLGGR